MALNRVLHTQMQPNTVFKGMKAIINSDPPVWAVSIQEPRALKEVDYERLPSAGKGRTRLTSRGGLDRWDSEPEICHLIYFELVGVWQDQSASFKETRTIATGVVEL